MFEFNSKKALAQIMVAVGEHDRRQGRDPSQNPTVETVLIAGHGDPDGIQTGPEEWLEVSDYAEAARRRQDINAEPNTYNRHLGNKYRIIFLACEVGGQIANDDAEEVPNDGTNIAQAISDGHQKRTTGSDKSIVGIAEIDPDGTVHYYARGAIGSKAYRRTGRDFYPQS